MEALNQNETLKCIVNTIVETANPTKVILFGSRARRDNENESDYDFIVLKRGIRNERLISRRIYRALFEKRIGVAVDIIVVDVDKFRKNIQKSYLFYSQAIKDGSTLYG